MALKNYTSITTTILYYTILYYYYYSLVLLNLYNTILKKFMDQAPETAFESPPSWISRGA